MNLRPQRTLWSLSLAVVFKNLSLELRLHRWLKHNWPMKNADLQNAYAARVTFVYFLSKSNQECIEKLSKGGLCSFNKVCLKACCRLRMRHRESNQCAMPMKIWNRLRQIPIGWNKFLPSRQLDSDGRSRWRQKIIPQRKEKDFFRSHFKLHYITPDVHLTVKQNWGSPLEIFSYMGEWHGRRRLKLWITIARGIYISKSLFQKQ